MAEGVVAARDRRRPLPLERGLPHAVASEADRRLRHPRRHVARPDLRAAVRPGHADPVDAAVHRERRSGRRLRLRLRLRLHRLDQLGVADRAAAGDSRSARGVREVVRRRRARPRSAPRAASHARSILDFVASEMSSLKRTLGPEDRGRMDRYLEDIREVERRIQRIEARNAAGGAARAGRRAGRRPRFVRGAREGDVRPPGAGVRRRHHARLLVQDGPRRIEPRVSGERVGQAVPSGVASRRHREGREGFLSDQQVSRQHAAVLPRQAEEHPGRRQATCSTRR